MQTCPRCGQLDSDESHQCAPTMIAVDQVTGVRSAVVALVILVLSFGLFAATLAFTVLHQQASAAPVIIQTTVPTNDITPTEQDITIPPSTTAPTATPAKHSGSGSGGGAAQPTPTPKTPSPTTPPLPTAVPPTPTDTPQPTPTRLPQ